MLQLDQNPDRLWKAVLDRDASAAGRFVFGVTSTGIYCCPGCPARTPKRERVRFFGDPGAAEAAGFRACLRCGPNRPAGPREAVRSARELLERSLQGIGLRELARRVGVSRSHLQRSFTKELGISPHQYSRAVRMRRARSSLAEGTPVTDAFYQAGFSSSRAFYEVAPGFLGMTPSEFQRGGDGVQIRYTASRSELGQLLVATTSRGVCSVKIGASVSDLERQLRPWPAWRPAELAIRNFRSMSVARSSSGRSGGGSRPFPGAAPRPTGSWRPRSRGRAPLGRSLAPAPPTGWPW
jgi:AraC family transcriptional regulator of adaptative response/methylated-DNA-[protein]-cysteine methyltransferase